MTDNNPPPDPPADVVTADAAALAANSAERAREAAAAAMTQAQIAAANVQHDAAQTISESEGRFEQWRTEAASESATQRGELSELKNRLDNLQTETATALSSILERLQPKPESPPNPNPAPSDVTPPPGTGAAETKPERRRAHRWI